MTNIAQSLDAMAEQATSIEQVRKEELLSGDRVLVTTRNSVYRVWVLGDGFYWVWGGWFDRKRVAPQRVGINGCTWGGSAIKQDILAACGLRVEFGNSVLTTWIRQVRVVRAEPQAAPN